MFREQIPSSALYKYLSAPIKYISKENNKRAKLHTTVNDKQNPGGGINEYKREITRLNKKITVGAVCARNAKWIYSVEIGRCIYVYQRYLPGES